MARFVQVIGAGEVLVPRVRWCADPICRLVGLQFRRRLDPDTGLVLVYPGNTVAGATIHMFFVFFPLGVVWVNHANQVVDKVLAKPWRPYYAPSAPARYILETEPQILTKIELGGELNFVDLPA